ncbi:exopolysaccharide biosynthesis protein [Chelonobacter oris]|uniref:Exopolysaccharide biosynthesis protein n=1 Tax=Chelonobacter oris TaxID=505317 RepID=A0A0A3APT5_9PAST|nr:DUF4422 domain-containing protein [Chelonobacter oris]KGQ71366.1 exopolysaccharide biosynthesis protein [Chelonobacter oris]
MKIIIATHKSYEIPGDEMYFPIQVGALTSSVKLNMLRDDLGDNISSKNSYFCELTGLYWAWKNGFFKDVSYFGLVHYRRYFFGKDIKLKNRRIASQAELSSILESYDCIVPKKRNYFIETVYSHYKHAHYERDLDKTRYIIIQFYPDYLDSFDSVMNGKTIHLYNMFVMRVDLLDSYCSWLFDILFKLEKEIDLSNYDQYQKRVFGFLAERLFNVWLLKNNINSKELKVVNIEGNNIVPKILNFLKRKFV